MGIIKLLPDRITERKLIVLAHHRVLDRKDELFPSVVDSREFESQLEFVCENFNVCTVTEALQRMRNGNLKPRTLCITFDDGYKDNVDNALPLLKKHNVPATFYVSTGFFESKIMWNDIVIESIRKTDNEVIDLSKIQLPCYQVASLQDRYGAISNILQSLKYLPLTQRKEASLFIKDVSGVVGMDELMMSESGVKLLHESGMEIGGHTINHPILSSVSDSEAELEISDSKSKLENIINDNIFSFAYPNGRPNVDYTIKHREIVKDAGFTSAVSTEWGVACKRSDYLQIPRIGIKQEPVVKTNARIASYYLKKCK